MVKENKNKGFSLVELIVVISIITIMAGGLVSLFGLLSGKHAKQASSGFNTALSAIKTETLAKSRGANPDNPDVYIELYTKDGLLMVDLYSYPSGAEGVNKCVVETKNIGRFSKFVMVYKTSTGSEETFAASDKMILAFNRSTAAIMPVKINGTDAGNIEYVAFRQGSRGYRISMTALTGKSEYHAE